MSMFRLKGRINKVQRHFSVFARSVWQLRIDIPGGLTQGRIWIDSAIKRKLDAELGMREIIRKKGAEARDYNAELRNLQEQLQRAKKMKSPDTRDSIRTIGERIRKLNGLIKLVSANIKQLKRDQKSGDNLLGANLSLYVETTRSSKVVKDSKKQRDEAKRMVA